MRQKRSLVLNAGMTLIELMIVIAIIGLLVALALPSMTRYVRQSKTVEAIMNIEVMTKAARAYFLSEHASPSGEILSKQLPGPSAQPFDLCADQPDFKCPGGRNGAFMTFDSDPTWQALNFSVDDPHWFVYWWEAQSGAFAGMVRGGGGSSGGPPVTLDHGRANAHSRLKNDVNDEKYFSQAITVDLSTNEVRTGNGVHDGQNSGGGGGMGGGGYGGGGYF